MNALPHSSAHVSGFDPEHFVPKPHPLAELHDRGESEKTSRYVIIRADGGNYVLLSPEDLQIWELIDGTRTVNEIGRVYLERHRRLALSRVYSLIRTLLAADIINAPGTQSKNTARPIWERIQLANRVLLPVPGSSAITKVAGRILKKAGGATSTALLVLLGLSAILGGIVAIIPGDTASIPVVLLGHAISTPFGTLHPGYAGGVIVLLFMHLVISFLREFSRAAVSSSCHNRPIEINLVLHYGIPAFQAASRFRPALPARERFAVSVAGIALELAVAGLAALAATLLGPQSLPGELASKFSWLLYFRTLMHFSPLASADICGILGLAGGISRFHQRAIGFLRTHLLDFLTGDQGIGREQRLYLTWNAIVVSWFFLLVVGIGKFATANQTVMHTMAGVEGSNGTTALIAVAVLLTPAAICMVIGVLFCLYLFNGWLITRPALQQPTLAAVLAMGCCAIWLLASLMLTKTTLIDIEIRDFMLELGALVIILAAGALTKRVPTALKGGRQTARFRLSQITTIAMGLFVLSEGTVSNLRQPCAWLVIVLLSVWIFWSIASGLSFISLVGSRVVIAELMATVGAGIAIGAALTVAGVLKSPAELPVAIFAATSLFAVGVTAAARGCLQWTPVEINRLPVSSADAIRTTLIQEIGSHVIRTAAAEIRQAFGPFYARHVAKAAGSAVPLNLDDPAQQLGNEASGYKDSILAIDQSILRRFGQGAADLVIGRALEAVHWRGRLALHEQILPGTRWAGHFAAEAAIRDGDRADRLERILLFQDLTAPQRQDIGDRLVAHQLPEGATIIEQGEQAEECFLIVSGDAQVEAEDDGGEVQILSYLTNGDFFGEAALLENTTRSASVRTITPTLVLSWSRQDFIALAKQAPETARSLIRQLQYMRVLLKIPLFADLPKDALRNLLPKLRAEKAPAGTEIVRQGENGTRFYLIQSGRVQVIKRSGDHDVVLCDLGDGDYFGEIALLRAQPRSATVRALADTQLLVLEKADFLRLTTASDLFATNLSTVSRDRLDSH